MNEVTLVGRLAQDPEPPTAENRPAKFTVVTNDYNPSTKQKEPEFHKCVAWGRSGDAIVNYAQKGRLVRVTGRLKTRSWDDAKHPGEKRYMTEIIANEVELLDSGPANHPPTQEDVAVSW